MTIATTLLIMAILYIVAIITFACIFLRPAWFYEFCKDEDDVDNDG